MLYTLFPRPATPHPFFKINNWVIPEIVSNRFTCFVTKYKIEKQQIRFRFSNEYLYENRQHVYTSTVRSPLDSRPAHQPVVFIHLHIVEPSDLSHSMDDK